MSEAEEVNQQIVMMGGSGVGKSSVLAVIYDEAKKAGLRSRELNVTLSPESETSRVILKKSNYLEAVCDGPLDQPFTFDPRDGNVTGFIERYDFHLGRFGTPPDLVLSFSDTAGEDFENISQNIHDALRSARVAMLVVDAVELKNSALLPPHARHNLPKNVLQFAESWSRDCKQDRPLLLLVVITKTETWMRERANVDPSAAAEELTQLVKNKYTDCFELFDEIDKDKGGCIAVAVLPVQTLGNVIFDHYDVRENGSVKEFYRRIEAAQTSHQNATGHAPRDCDHVFRHILNFFLIHRITMKRRQKAQQADGFWSDVDKALEFVPNKIRAQLGINDLREFVHEVKRAVDDVFGSDRTLARAIAEFSHKARSGGTVHILRGKNLMIRPTLWDKWFKLVDFVQPILDKIKGLKGHADEVRELWKIVKSS